MTRNSRPPALLRRPAIDDDLDGTGGITELEKFDPERVDGVSTPANGFPVLLMKALGNSGTAARLICGLLAGHPIFAVMTGDASLRRRPMKRSRMRRHHRHRHRLHRLNHRRARDKPY